MMMKHYPYLQDSEFMYLADTQKLQSQYLKLTLLSWDEKPLQEIQGIATGGTISINGSSSVRRTCTLSMTVKDVSTGKITDAKNLISLNKKVYIEIGIKNRTGKYTEYPILWYPQGLFVFTSCSLSNGVNSTITLSAQLKDKMCLLNGECGGVIPAAVEFDQYDTIDPSSGEIITTKPTINQIVRELVNHYGGEQLVNIIINDIDEKVKMAMKWTGSNPVYLATKDSSNLITTNLADAIAYGGSVQTFNYGQDVGFIFTDFTYPSELTANAGDNVCTILDKIKSTLGNYEYYYDIWGNFIFQEIKNYLNTTQATLDLRYMSNSNYIIDIAKGKSVYKFNDGKLITNYSNSPQYSKIKNDYVVWGIKTGTDNTSLPIRYHLAIDKKPTTGNIYDVFFYLDPSDELTKAKCPVVYDNEAGFPTQGAEEVFYMSKITGLIYKWDAELQAYVSPEGAPYSSYNTKADFPEVGDSGIIYVSTSDQKQYTWVIDSTSEHYAEVAAALTELREEYDEAVEPHNEQIIVYQAELEELEDELQENKNNMSSWTIQKENIEDELVEPYEKLTEYTTRKEELETLIEDDNTRLTELESEILSLQKQISAETDETKKLELQKQLNLDIAERTELQTEIPTLESELEDVEISIDDVNEIISDLEAELAEVEAELAPYEEIATQIQEKIDNVNAQIETEQEAIDQLTETYTTERAELLAGQGEYQEYAGTTMVKVQATDWRSELYLAGAAAEPLGLSSNYYYAELAAEWPKLYNLQASSYTDEETGETIYTGAFYDDVLENPWDVDYWLDFIDSEGAISEFNVDNIGRRTVVENSDDYNCVFESEIPDLVIIETGDTAEEKRKECEDRNQDYCQVDSNIYELLIIGGSQNSCFNEIKNLLWEDTDYNSSVSLTVVPIYHLEPNTRITIQSNDSDIHGDFMIGSISIPLTITGNMSISATQVQTKL